MKQITQWKVRYVIDKGDRYFIFFCIKTESEKTEAEEPVSRDIHDMRLSNKARAARSRTVQVMGPLCHAKDCDAVVSGFCVQMTGMNLKIVEMLIIEKVMKCSLHKMEVQCSLKTVYYSRSFHA